MSHIEDDKQLPLEFTFIDANGLPAKLYARSEIRSQAYIVKFDDTDMEDVVFSGKGAREAAERFYASKCSTSWTCHLFKKITLTANPMLEILESPRVVDTTDDCCSNHTATYD